MQAKPDLQAPDMAAAGWPRLEDIVARFELAWQDGSEPEIDRFLPSAEDPLRPDVLVELIKVDQEYRWQNADRRGVETYLREWPELEASDELVADLVAAECATRASVGDRTSCTSFQAEIGRRFPQLDLTADAYRIGRRWLSDLQPGRSFELEVPAGLQLRPGDKFHHYQIEECLGEGGMGVVYRVTQTVLDRARALKIPKFAPGTEQAMKDRLVQEARLAAKVEHKNVCRVYDAGEWQGNYYICMELVDGPPLSRLLDAGPLVPRKAAEMALSLALALQAAHDEGVLHRDIKPSNIMLTLAGEPKLTDFGLARPAQPAEEADRAETRFCSGTPDYMSPEQARGDAVDCRSDVFSLGLVLFEMLSGSLPPGREIGTVGAAELSTICRGRDATLTSICLKAIAPEPANRYQSAGEMAAALGSHLASLDRPRRIRQSWLLVAVAASLLLGVLFTLRTPDGTLVIEVEPKDVRVEIDGREVHLKSPRDEIRVTVGEHQLVVQKDGFETRTESFQIRRNGRTEISVRLVPTSRVLFEDRFQGDKLDRKIWDVGHLDLPSRPGKGKTSHRYQQQTGGLRLEAHAEHEEGYTCQRLVWLDAVSNLLGGERGTEDVTLEIVWSAQANIGLVALELTDGKQPADGEDSGAVRLFSLRGEKSNPISVHQQRLRIAISRSAETATVYTPEGMRRDPAAISLKSLQAWRLRFLIRAGSSAGREPSHVALDLHWVRARRGPAQASVAGRVVDVIANRGIRGAEVRFGNAIATTEADGTFLLSPVAPGRQPLHASAREYIRSEADTAFVRVEQGRRTWVDVAMRRTRFGYGHVVDSKMMAASVQSIVISPQTIYFTRAIREASVAESSGGFAALFQMPVTGGDAVQLGEIKLTPSQQDRPEALLRGSPKLLSVKAGMTWADGVIYGVDCWPGRIFRVATNGELTLLHPLEIDWPASLAFDGKRFWFLESSPLDKRCCGVYAIDPRSGRVEVHLPSDDKNIAGLAWGLNHFWVSSLQGQVYEIDMARAIEKNQLLDGIVNKFAGKYDRLGFCDGYLWGLDLEARRLCKIKVQAD